MRGGAEPLCALGGGDGRLLVFAPGAPERAARLRLFEGPVLGLSWAARPGPSLGPAALLVSGPGGTALWMDVTCGPGQLPAVRLMGRYRLPPCKQRWHTCAAFLPQGGLLLCGDRRGSLLLFPCSGSEGTDRDTSGSEGTASQSEFSCLLNSEAVPLEDPLSVLFGLHGKTGVTSVTCHGDYIYSTGRDGCYRQLCLRDRQLEVLQKHRPCKGLQWIEELRFTPGGDLLVLGFHADNFVVWSTRSGVNLHCVPCGGGHRSWSYYSCPEADAFAYIKRGDVMLYHSEAEPCEQRVLLASLHGREIACVRHLGAVRVPGSHPVNIFITGSEDTTACVLTLSELTRAAVPLARLSDHISSVRALALADTALRDGTRLCSLLFSAGGRAQIECYCLQCAVDLGAEGMVSCQVAHVASHRLDEHWDRMKNRHKLVKMDPETRYMSLSVVCGTNSEQLPMPCTFLVAACSDGSVRLFVLLEAAQKLLLIAESFHHQRCVLKVEAFLHTRAEESAATDGSVVFWDITGTIAAATDALQHSEGEMQPLGGYSRGQGAVVPAALYAAVLTEPLLPALGTPLLTVMAHSCGVNSLHIQELPKGQFLVASGSD
ncbi:hypothetical protein CIB84_016398, partial [Bambusicola thoracicus]